MLLVSKKALLAIVLSVLGVSVSANVSCKDEQGLDVDWFYLYKLPKNHHSSLDKGSTGSGLEYIYITCRSYDDWQSSKIKISESESMPALTLQPIFSDPTVLLVAYNDEFPNGTTFSSGGHTKGVVATDGVTGLWLIHSVPKFPTIPHYEYPSTGTHYGQSFLCLTLSATEIEKVGAQLIYNEPSFYYSRIPLMLDGKFPTVEKAIEKKWHTHAPFINVIDLETLAGKTFKSFAKNGRYEKDLYEDWVAPELDVNLLVETWRNGGGNLASNCSQSEKVYNIADIEEPSLQLSFKTTTDHSKWAVSQQTGLKLWRWRLGGSAAWICVGDINRQQHQMQRGGGTVCQKNTKVANLYRGMIGSFEPCAKV